MSREAANAPGGEFELIERYFFRPVRDDAAVRVPPGDDAAVVDPGGPIAIAVDTLVAGVHFPDDCPAHALGHRALAVNLSDLAATAAEPRWCTLALTVPEADHDWFAAFADGLFTLAERFGVTLVGGDLTRGPLTVTLQILGRVDTPLTRAGGAAGDDVWVTGTLGDAAAGLEACTRGQGADDSMLARRFLYPEPRVAAGRALAGLAHAAIDVSDGLLADLGHVVRQSECGAAVDVGALPLSQELVAAVGLSRARELALTGGDDYELCFAVPPDAAAQVRQALDALGVRATRVGRLTEQRGLACTLDGAAYSPGASGYTHF